MHNIKLFFIPCFCILIVVRNLMLGWPNVNPDSEGTRIIIRKGVYGATVSITP